MAQYLISHIPNIQNPKHPAFQAFHIPNISHSHILHFNIPYAKNPTSPASYIPISYIPNIPHSKHSTCQTSHIPNIFHVPNIAHPKHCISLTSHIANILHPKHPASQTFHIPNIRHPVQKDLNKDFKNSFNNIRIQEKWANLNFAQIFNVFVSGFFLVKTTISHDHLEK